MGDGAHIGGAGLHEFLEFAKFRHGVPIAAFDEGSRHLCFEADRRKSLPHRVVKLLGEAESFRADVEFGIELTGAVSVAQNVEAPEGGERGGEEDEGNAD